MKDVLDPPIRDLVEWVAKEPRPYSEVMAAWRTSCPRLTVWEDASVPSPNCRPVFSTLARQFGDKGTLADSKD